MAKNTSLVVLGGALAMLAAASVAGWVAGSLGGGAAPAPSPSVRAPAGDDTLDSEEIDRRLEALEERLRQIEDASYSGLDLRDEVEALRADVNRLLGTPERGVIAPPPTEPISLATDDDSNGADDSPEARAAKFREEVRAFQQKQGPNILRAELARIVDSTEGADGRRRSQVYAEAQRTAVAYFLGSGERDELITILTETMEEQVREVGPYLRGGLDRADYVRVGEVMGRIWDARDARMKEVFDEESWKTFEAEQKGWREMMSRAFARLDKERAGR